MSKIIQTLLLITIFVGALVVCYYVGYHKAETSFVESPPDTVYIYQTVVDTMKIPKFIVKRVKENVNIDSLYEVAKDYWKKIYQDSLNEALSYIAVADSVYKDSLLTAHVKFISRIPLDPAGYFDLDFKVRESSISTSIIQPKTNWFKNRFVIYTGVGLSITYNRLLPSIQIGAGIRLK